MKFNLWQMNIIQNDSETGAASSKCRNSESYTPTLFKPSHKFATKFPTILPRIFASNLLRFCKFSKNLHHSQSLPSRARFLSSICCKHNHSLIRIWRRKLVPSLSSFPWLIDIAGWARKITKRQTETQTEGEGKRDVGACSVADYNAIYFVCTRVANQKDKSRPLAQTRSSAGFPLLWL